MSNSCFWILYVDYNLNSRFLIFARRRGLRRLFLLYSCFNKSFLNLWYIRGTYRSPSRNCRGVFCVFRFFKDLSLFTSSRLSSSRARATESNLPINSYLSRPLYVLWTTGDTIGNCNWILVFTFKSILAALCSHPHVPLSVYASSPTPSVPLICPRPFSFSFSVSI